MRKVTLFSTLINQKKELMTAATTWGQLKSESEGFVSSDVKGIIKSTRNVLDDDNALLPEGEFVVFITADKIKSGKWTKI